MRLASHHDVLSSVSLSCTLSAPVYPLSVPLLLFARPRNSSVALSPPSRYPFISVLSRHLSLAPAARPYISHSIGALSPVLVARRASSRRPSLSRSLSGLCVNTRCVYLLMRSRLSSLSLGASRAHSRRPRNSVESRDVPSTPWCAARSAPEGRRREIQWRGSFLHERENCDGGASSLSLFFSR